MPRVRCRILRVVARAVTRVVSGFLVSLLACGCWGGAGVAIPPATIAPPQAAAVAEGPAPATEAATPIELRLLGALSAVAESSRAPERLADEVRAELEQRGCAFAGPLREADASELTIRLAACDDPTTPLSGVVHVAFVPAEDGVRAVVELDGATLGGETWDGRMLLAVRGGDVRLEAFDAAARPAATPTLQPFGTSVGFGPYASGAGARPPLLQAIEGTFQLLFALGRIVALFG